MLAALDRKIGSLVGIVTAGLVVAACAAPAGKSGSSSPSCAAMLTFRGRVYGGTTLRTHAPYDKTGVIPLSHLHEIGKATQPPCNDTGRTSPSTQLQQVEVARIDEVDPGTAIALFPTGYVYLMRGAAIPPVLTTAPWVRWYHG
jgi:hypothetical protein